jgi:uroporphyrinogen-III decarboxylase
LHYDSDWTKNLEYLLELPAKKFILELDGDTDIFKAKEILGGHCAIMGDMPAALLAIGSTSEVDEYAKKLITVVGKGGGLLYSSGCCVPMNAKHENVKAFFDAVEKYGRYN